MASPVLTPQVPAVTVVLCPVLCLSFKEAPSLGGLQGKQLSSTANERRNAVPKYRLEVMFQKHEVAEVSEQILVQCQPSFNRTVPVFSL